MTRRRDGRRALAPSARLAAAPAPACPRRRPAVESPVDEPHRVPTRAERRRGRQAPERPHPAALLGRLRLRHGRGAPGAARRGLVRLRAAPARRRGRGGDRRDQVGLGGRRGRRRAPAAGRHRVVARVPALREVEGRFVPGRDLLVQHAHGRRRGVGPAHRAVRPRAGATTSRSRCRPGCASNRSPTASARCPATAATPSSRWPVPAPSARSTRARSSRWRASPGPTPTSSTRRRPTRRSSRPS